MSGAIETLFLPFASGDIDPPDEGARFAFLNAAVPPLPGGFASSALACEQGFRPAFLALQRAERVMHVLHGLRAVLHGRVEVPILAEVVTAAIGPVELVEVHIIGVEPLQRSFKRATDRIG